METAAHIKEQGNKVFVEGRYAEAASLYTRALFTNRANCRLKLSQWTSCLDDSLKAIDLFPPDDKPTPIKMKAYYYLAEAQLNLGRPGEALASAIRAYDMCRALSSPSIEQLSLLVLRAKKERWSALENDRLHRKSTLLQDVEAGLQKLYEVEQKEERMKTQGDPSQSDFLVEEDGVQEERLSGASEAYERRLQEVREIFARADPDGVGQREVPDYLVDNITFTIMQDPVITKNGHSYERATILSHLRRSETDPLTRDHLTVKDLRPNLALKEASASFLDDNGWAVDW